MSKAEVKAEFWKFIAHSNPSLFSKAKSGKHATYQQYIFEKCLARALLLISKLRPLDAQYVGNSSFDEGIGKQEVTANLPNHEWYLPFSQMHMSPTR